LSEISPLRIEVMNELVRLRDLFARMDRIVSWSNHGEIDRGEALDRLAELANEATSKAPEWAP
jgi:hypothetical protein